VLLKLKVEAGESLSVTTAVPEPSTDPGVNWYVSLALLVPVKLIVSLAEGFPESTLTAVGASVLEVLLRPVNANESSPSPS
jgi:hypothetical protein